MLAAGLDGPRTLADARANRRKHRGGKHGVRVGLEPTGNPGVSKHDDPSQPHQRYERACATYSPKRQCYGGDE